MATFLHGRMIWAHRRSLWSRAKMSERAAVNGYLDRAPVVIWPADRERWLQPGARVGDLISAESADRFDVRPVTDAEIAAELPT